MVMGAQQWDRIRWEAEPGCRLVVLGDPVAHSLSPAMHNAALAAMAARHPQFAAWRYQAIHVPEGQLAHALPVLHEAGVAGINLTLPHKVVALELVQAVETEARQMGAVNTLMRADNGFTATNTDGFGITRAIGEAFDRSLRDADIWLFGAGGAARGIIVACLAAGARRITVLNRSQERLESFAEALLANGGHLPGLQRVRFAPLAGAPADPAPDAILINATSLGLKATDPNPVAEDFLRPGRSVYDTTYGVENALARACRAAGVAYADGLSMLVWQGARSLEIWTGHSVPAPIMREAALQALTERQKHG